MGTESLSLIPLLPRQFTAACIVALLVSPRSRISPFFGATTTITISTGHSNSSVASGKLADTSSTSTVMAVPKKQPLSLYASQYGDSELGYSGLRTIVPEEVTYQSPARFIVGCSRALSSCCERRDSTRH